MHKLAIKQRDSLIEQYIDYVHSIVGKLIKHLNLPNSNFDEYVAAGYMGLVEAADRFNPESGSNFKSFAFLRIRGAIIDSIRATSELTGKAYHLARAMQLVNDLRQTQSAESLAEMLEFAAKGVIMYRLSLSDTEREVGNLTDKSHPEKDLQSKQELNFLINIIKQLPEKQKLIITEHYLKDKSFIQISRSQKRMSKSWVSRLHDRAIENLKRLYLENKAD